MNAKVVKVIQTVELAGKGSEDDPHREIAKYWTLDGQLLAVNDPVEEGACDPKHLP